eukprot:FR740808.1.p1 GENE.FR740808.1~~FR740808.1.p1  ORF type:complete len:196 (+),score=23.95 FR740808.1:120-707(+)
MALNTQSWEDGSLLAQTREKLNLLNLDDRFIDCELLPRFPQLLRLDPRKIEATALYLRIEFGQDGMVNLVTASPELLGYDVEEHLMPAMKFLEVMMGSSFSQFARNLMCAAEPTLVGWAVEESIRERRVVELVKDAVASNNEDLDRSIQYELQNARQTMDPEDLVAKEYTPYLTDLLMTRVSHEHLPIFRLRVMR